jgi:uncharacterized lipoprotein YddW (UPF0748 family)
MRRRDFLAIGMGGGLALGNMPFPGLLAQGQDSSTSLPEQWVWIRSRSKEGAYWKQVCETLGKNHIHGLLIEGGDIPVLEVVIPIAKIYGIHVHSWFWTMNRPHDKQAWEHPDWFAVSRAGKSCYEKQPYVDYYKWVCPSKPQVVDHIQSEVEKLCHVPGLKGIHLDYIRYPDVILPVALQPKYNLVQDREFPEYDFCYCPDCQKQFKKETGIDIMKLKDPTANQAWREYRYTSITHVVNRLAKVVHSHDKLITAAVFPYPDLARTICRQSWNDWDLDGAFPMIYNFFYNEGVPWIGKAVANGVRDLKGKCPLYCGLFIEEMTTAEIVAAKKQALAAGAKGVCYFAYSRLDEEIYQAVNIK